MHDAPLLSIAIPAYNYGRYLPRAIASALDQKIAATEVLIVDDCSTDDTPQIVAPFLDTAGVRYLRNERNLGAVKNINKAIAATRGRFVLLLGADDFLLPGALQALLDALARYPDAGFAYGNYVVADEHDRILETIRHPGHLPLSLPPWRDDFPDLLSFDDYINLGTTLFRREVIEQFGFFDERLSIDEDNRRFFRATDWDLCLRLSLAGIRSAFVYSTLSAFRVHSGQASIGGDFDREGIGLREFSVLLERYVRPENAARLAGHEESILRLMHGKASVCAEQADPDLLGDLGLLGARLQHAESTLRSIAENRFDAAMAESPVIAAILVADDNPEDLLPTLADIEQQTKAPATLVINRGRMDMSHLVGGRKYIQACGTSVAAARDFGVRLCDQPALCFVTPGSRFGNRHFEIVGMSLAQEGVLVAQSSETPDAPSGKAIASGGSWKNALAALTSEDHPWREQVPSLTCFSMRRHVYFRLGGFEPSLPLLEDLDFVLRLRDRFSIAQVPGSLRAIPTLQEALKRERGRNSGELIAQSLQAIALRRGRC